jgi:hypothetical protein
MPEGSHYRVGERGGARASNVWLRRGSKRQVAGDMGKERGYHAGPDGYFN